MLPFLYLDPDAEETTGGGAAPVTSPQLDPDASDPVTSPQTEDSTESEPTSQEPGEFVVLRQTAQQDYGLTEEELSGYADDNAFFAEVVRRWSGGIPPPLVTSCAAVFIPTVNSICTARSEKMTDQEVPPYRSLGELADVLGVHSWRIARLFQLGILPEPPRLGGRRLIPTAMVPETVDALRDRGWLTHHKSEASYG